MIYLKYLKYLIKHKLFVLIECFKFGLYWQGLIHDLSKLRLSEFISYARYFYGWDKLTQKEKFAYDKAKAKTEREFDLAWLYHIHRNPHHWQFWILIQDEDEDKILPMPDKYIKEMVCDWKGAGKVQGNHNTLMWYNKHKDKMQLHPRTRDKVEDMLITKEIKRVKSVR